MARHLNSQQVLAGAYAGAHMGKSLFWYAGDLLFVFFLTEFGGLDARSAGLVLGLALAFSAVADLVVAKLLGNRIASMASAGRLQLIGTVVCAATFVMFAFTAVVDPAFRLAFACVASLLFRATYAVIDVPQNAMLGLAAANDRDRTRLAGLRIIFSGAASLLVSALAGLLIASLSRPHAVTTAVLTSAALGGAAVIGSAVLASATKRQRLDLALPGAISIVHVLRRRDVMLPVAMGASVAATTALFNKLQPYYAAFALGTPIAATILLTATALGGGVSQVVWAILVRRLGARIAGMTAAGALFFGAALFFGLAPLGPWGAAVGGLTYGAGVGGLNLINWTVLAAVARPLGERAELGAAATFSAFTFASKISNAAAIILIGELLARSSYRQVGSSGEWPLLGLMCLAPIVGALVYAFLSRHLPGDRQSKTG